MANQQHRNAAAARSLRKEEEGRIHCRHHDRTPPRLLVADEIAREASSSPSAPTTSRNHVRLFPATTSTSSARYLEPGILSTTLRLPGSRGVGATSRMATEKAARPRDLNWHLRRNMAVTVVRRVSAPYRPETTSPCSPFRVPYCPLASAQAQPATSSSGGGAQNKARQKRAFTESPPHGGDLLLQPSAIAESNFCVQDCSSDSDKARARVGRPPPPPHPPPPPPLVFSILIVNSPVSILVLRWSASP